jgi:hypothetical protein
MYVGFHSHHFIKKVGENLKMKVENLSLNFIQRIKFQQGYIFLDLSLKEIIEN